VTFRKAPKARYELPEPRKLWGKVAEEPTAYGSDEADEDEPPF
jgi:hypothetical protein